MERIETKREKDYILYKGDCRVILKTLEDVSIDVVLADIPYGIDYASWDVLHSNKNSALGGSSLNQATKTSFKRRGKPLNGWSKADKEIPYEYESWCNSWARELYRITKPASPILIFSSRRMQHRVCTALEDSGFIIKDILIWQKDRCNAKAQKLENVLEKRIRKKDNEKELEICKELYRNYRLGNLAPYYEPIIYAIKPYRGTLTDCVLNTGLGEFNCPINSSNKIPSNILSYARKGKNTYHETEKPVELIEYLLQLFSMDGHTILDFTMGSGTTGVGCMRTNRKFIGIELDSKYYNTAVSRLQQETHKLKKE